VSREGLNILLIYPEVSLSFLGSEPWR